MLAGKYEERVTKDAPNSKRAAKKTWGRGEKGKGERGRSFQIKKRFRKVAWSASRVLARRQSLNLPLLALFFTEIVFTNQTLRSSSR
jgi:hypothetical protein